VHKRFEVVWQPSPADTPVVLTSTADANAATMAFYEEFARLRRQEAPGELLVRRGIHRHSNHAQHPLLRQPLNHHKHHA
jgi:hypothetical protein